MPETPADVNRIKYRTLLAPLNATYTTGLNALDERSTVDDANLIIRTRNAGMTRAANACWPTRDHLTPDLIREVEEDTKAQGRKVYNGCTLAWLRERYPDVQHQMGVGWYLPTTHYQPELTF